jgi:hypothetical protein
VIGGYSLEWAWIGYLGHSLRDWLQLLLVPLVFPAILIPAMLSFVSGDVAGRVLRPRAYRRPSAHPHREPPASAPGPALSSPGGLVNAEGGADQPVRRARLDASGRFPDRPSGCQPTAPRR